MELVPNSNVQSIEAYIQYQDALNFNTGDLSGLIRRINLPGE